MNHPVSLEGQLEITLSLAMHAQHAEVCGVTVRSSRTLNVTDLFTGLTYPQVLPMIGQLFSLCANAQSCAAVRAFENASATPCSPQVANLRQAAVDIESLREQLWRLLLRWPAFSGQAPNKAAMAKVLQSKKQFDTATGGLALFHTPGLQHQACDFMAVREAVDTMVGILEQYVLGTDCQTWLKRDSALTPSAVTAEMNNHQQQPSIAEQFTHTLHANGWQYACPTSEPALPAFDETALRQLVTSMQEPAFIAQPHYHGNTCETSSFTRMSAKQQNVLRQQYGDGLWARAVAVLNEVTALANNLRAFFAEDSTEKATYPHSDDNNIVALGHVRAARGQLFHSVTLDGTLNRQQAGDCDKMQIQRYRILAPTEWNFHPHGVVESGLLGLIDTKAAIEQQARLFIELLDPCVGYQLHFVEQE